DVRLPWRTEAQRILAVLERLDGPGGRVDSSGSNSSDSPDGQSSSSAITADAATDMILAALETGRAMPALTRQHIRAMVAKFVGVSVEAAAAAAAAGDNTGSGSGEFRDPVLRLLLGRLRTHVLGRLAAASATEK